MSEALGRLATLLRDEGGLIATLVVPDAQIAVAAQADGSPARAAAEGPQAEGRRAEYELLVEAIYEGYLLHYGSPRVLRAADANLRLLAGDRLYAIGLALLIPLGDTAAVA